MARRVVALLLLLTTWQSEAWVSSIFPTMSTNTAAETDVLDLLELARKLGPVGIRQSSDDQQLVIDAAIGLSSKSPARVPLRGVHKLVYSSAPGGSSGKLGFVDGRVTQTFVDDSTFINSVKLGPVELALTASRTVKSDTSIQVKFKKTTVFLLGRQIVEKEIAGGGVWKCLYAGVVTDKDGKEKLVRVMQTPSLFVLEQPIEEQD